LRWVHSKVITTTTSKWHQLTSYFAKNIFDKLAVINNHWSHYHTIEQLESKKKILTKYSDLNIYENFSFPKPTNLNQAIKISKIMEHNLLTNFNELKKKYKCTLKNYEKNSITTIDSSGQKEPDIVIDATNATVSDNRIHGMDQKSTQSTNAAASKIYSAMSTEIFERTLDLFYQELHFNENYLFNN
jgi:hypothetical protein